MQVTCILRWHIGNFKFAVCQHKMQVTCTLRSHIGNFKFAVCRHKMQVTPIKLSKFISSANILNTNQMLIGFFPHVTKAMTSETEDSRQADRGLHRVSRIGSHRTVSCRRRTRVCGGTNTCMVHTQEVECHLLHSDVTAVQVGPNATHVLTFTVRRQGHRLQGPRFHCRQH